MPKRFRRVLNLGCGDNPLKLKGLNVKNLDALPNKGVDIVCNVVNESIPVKDGYFDEIWMFHMIEHLTKIQRADVLFELNRVLRVGGIIIFTYPEFEVCAKNFLENKDGNRDFWEATLYGRQSHSFDYHLVPMHTKLFQHELIDYGFRDIKSDIESKREPFNTITTAFKRMNICTREDVIAREVCNQ